MKRVCEHGRINGKVSPLCGNWTLYESLKGISEANGVPFSIALGITYAESHIGVNYAGTCDASFNNWGGVKWRIGYDGTAIKDQPVPVKYNGGSCWLYRFGSVEDYWASKMRTLSKYRSCFSQAKPITCISYKYVGDADVAETSWINRVALISE